MGCTILLVMEGARHTFPECLNSGCLDNESAMVCEQFFLGQALAYRSLIGQSMVTRIPPGLLLLPLYSLATSHLALGSVWNWSELGSLMKGENVML